jgi:hypothetical protein
MTAVRSGFRPPAPVLQTKPLGPLALLRTLRNNPLECWTEAHFEEPTMLGGFPFARVAVVSDPGAIREILVENPTDYSKSALERRILSSRLRAGLVAADGDDWVRQRRTLAPFFARKMLRLLVPEMARTAERLCRREEVVLVGGGNSAGQAAVFLRDYAAKIWLLVRGPSLTESMSRYLIDRISATSNIEVLTNTEVVALSGSPQGQLERIWWRNRLSGEATEKAIRHLFLFIGAEPATGWLHGCVSLDAKGFVQTGTSVSQEARSASNGAQSLSLQSNIPGVFAVGDVRSGSVKRVGAAIGEGAGVVAQLHTYLNGTPKGAAVHAPLAAKLPPDSPQGSVSSLPRGGNDYGRDLDRPAGRDVATSALNEPR